MTRARPQGPDDEARATQEFDRFFRAHVDAVRRHIRWLDQDVDDEAVADDAFLTTWQQWRSLEDPRKFVYAAARHGVLNGRRKAKRQAVPVDPDDGHVAMVPPTADGYARWELLEALDEVELLPRHLRNALKLDAFGLSTAEIAEEIGCSKRTVSTYLSEARQRLTTDDGDDRAGGKGRSGGRGPGGTTEQG